jgi:hypothetical protein
MAGNRLVNLGRPQNPGDGTTVDRTSVPQPASGAGFAGSSLLAAPADHVHPAAPIGVPSTILQFDGQGEAEVIGPAEEVIWQRFVDFGGVIGTTVNAVFSAFVSVDAGTGTFNLRLGGTPGAADGDAIATLTTQSATPQPAIVGGPAVPRPGVATLLKLTAKVDSAGATARIADLRVTLTG